jgi:hypothetical protein
MNVPLNDSAKLPILFSLTTALALIVSGCGQAPVSSGTGTPSASPSTTQPAAQAVSISSPTGSATVSSPFTLMANAPSCSSQTVTSIGYSLDGDADMVVVNGTTINLPVVATAGSHTLTVDAWNSSGAECSATVDLTVAQPPPPPNPNVPENAISVASIQALGQWAGVNDPESSGSSLGTTAMVSSPSLSGNARQFVTSFSNSGDERYWVTFGSDTDHENFFYDAWVYLDGSPATIANLEFDMNQVLANGQTVIFGFQCDGYSGTWDYVENTGSPAIPIDNWDHANAPCNPRNWTPDVWHHLQISYARDDAGNVTYQSVWLDGAESQINATVPSAFALGWSSVLLTNFEVDGLGNGSNTVYLDNLTVSRW